MADMEKNIPADEQVESVAEVSEQETPAAPVSSKTEGKKAKAKKDKKPNFFVRLGRRLAKFWRDYVSEAKKVKWNSWKNVWKSSWLVVVVVVIISAVVLGIDSAFGALFQWLARIIH